MYSLTHTPVSNTNKTYWLTKLDFHVICTLVYFGLPGWNKMCVVCLPRKSFVTQHMSPTFLALFFSDEILIQSHVSALSIHSMVGPFLFTRVKYLSVSAGCVVPDGWCTSLVHSGAVVIHHPQKESNFSHTLKFPRVMHSLKNPLFCTIWSNLD